MEQDQASNPGRMAEPFNAYFGTWQIALPQADLEARRRGSIRAAGWSIWYLFGADERGEYLDYYATHRMTNERHLRVYASGETVQLPAPLPFMVFPPDASPAEKERIERDYFAHNRDVGELLRAKGFGI